MGDLEVREEQARRLVELIALREYRTRLKLGETRRHDLIYIEKIFDFEKVNAEIVELENLLQTEVWEA